MSFNARRHHCFRMAQNASPWKDESIMSQTLAPSDPAAGRSSEVASVRIQGQKQSLVKTHRIHIAVATRQECGLISICSNIKLP